MVDIVGTSEFEQWFLELEENDIHAVVRCVDRLAILGIALRYPHSSEIKGTQYPLRELRIQSKGRPLRVFYTFDPERQAVLLIGGDKTGTDRFYKQYIPRAEKIWEAYLEQIASASSK